MKLRKDFAIYLADADDGLPPSQVAPEIYNRAVSSFSIQVRAAVEQSRSWQNCRNPDEADVIIVREQLGFKNWHYIPTLQHNTFLRRFAEKIIVYNAEDRAVPFFPGFYTSLCKSIDCVIEAEPFPYWSTFLDRNTPSSVGRSLKLLWYFRGSLRTHRVRRKMYRALAGERDGIVESSQSGWGQNTENERKMYVSGLQCAHFALCPRGASPSSFRLYEAMQLGTAPVVISDEWQPPKEIAWGEFAVFVKERDVADIPRILRSAEHESDARGRIARAEWERALSSQQIATYFLRQLELFVRTKWVPRSFDELWSIWHSRVFERSNGWHLAGRAYQRLGRHASALDQHIFFLFERAKHLRRGSETHADNDSG
jgi:exostosin family protein